MEGRLAPKISSADLTVRCGLFGFCLVKDPKPPGLEVQITDWMKTELISSSCGRMYFLVTGPDEADDRCVVCERQEFNTRVP